MKTTWISFVTVGVSMVACGGSVSDQSPGDFAGGSGGAGAYVGSGGAGASTATGGAGANGGGGASGAKSSGGGRAIASGGSGAVAGGGAGGTSSCCPNGCDEPCTPGSTRSCGSPVINIGEAQDCRCDGTGWGAIRSITASAGACFMLDAGPHGPHVDAGAAADAASSDANLADGGKYCVYESNGNAGAPPVNFCLPFPKGCTSCACIALPHPYCTCTDSPGGAVSVRCLGV